MLSNGSQIPDISFKIIRTFETVFTWTIPKQILNISKIKLTFCIYFIIIYKYKKGPIQVTGQII